MAISLVEVEIWYFLVFNVRRRICIIILLQGVTMQFRRLFWHISNYKVRQSNFITKCDRLLLQSESGITKCERLLLQSALGITKCDSYYKVVYPSAHFSMSVKINFSCNRRNWKSWCLDKVEIEHLTFLSSDNLVFSVPWEVFLTKKVGKDNREVDQYKNTSIPQLYQPPRTTSTTCYFGPVNIAKF